MIMGVTNKPRLLSSLILVLVLAGTGLSQEAKKDVLGRRIALFEKTATVHVILQHLAQTYRIPIGFENLPEGMSPSVIHVKVQDGSLREVLNEITRVDPRYSWEEVDGVVNVLPTDTRETLSLILVPQFRIEGKNREDLSRAITDIPAVRTFLINNRIRRYDIDDSLTDPAKLRRFSLALEKATVREILNSTLNRSGSHYWVVERYGKENNWVTINIGF